MKNAFYFIGIFLVVSAGLIGCDKSPNYKSTDKVDAQASASNPRSQINPSSLRGGSWNCSDGSVYSFNDLSMNIVNHGRMVDNIIWANYELSEDTLDLHINKIRLPLTDPSGDTIDIQSRALLAQEEARKGNLAGYQSIMQYSYLDKPSNGEILQKVTKLSENILDLQEQSISQNGEEIPSHHRAIHCERSDYPPKPNSFVNNQFKSTELSSRADKPAPALSIQAENLPGKLPTAGSSSDIKESKNQSQIDQADKQSGDNGDEFDKDVVFIGQGSTGSRFYYKPNMIRRYPDGSVRLMLVTPLQSKLGGKPVLSQDIVYFCASHMVSQGEQTLTDATTNQVMQWPDSLGRQRDKFEPRHPIRPNSIDEKVNSIVCDPSYSE